MDIESAASECEINAHLPFLVDIEWATVAKESTWSLEELHTIHNLPFKTAAEKYILTFPLQVSDEILYGYVIQVYQSL